MATSEEAWKKKLEKISRDTPTKPTESQLAAARRTTWQEKNYRDDGATLFCRACQCTIMHGDVPQHEKQNPQRHGNELNSKGHAEPLMLQKFTEDLEAGKYGRRPPHPSEVWAAAFARGESFQPDWSQTWTKEQMEKELAPFTFKGPGWYSIKYKPAGESERLNTSLVLPTADKDRFLFCEYGTRTPQDIFGWIVNAPTRRDDR